MSNSLEVSICISMLNEEINARRCIESVLQSCKNFNSEIILLNNGSSDGTKEILASYEELEGLRVVSFDQTVGLNVARNFLLNQCNSELAIFLDADGVVSVDYVATLLKNVSPEFSIYSGPVPEQSSKKNVFFELHYRTLMQTDPNFLIGANFAVNVRDALAVGGFPNITVKRGDESPLITLMKNEGAKQRYIRELVASNHFIASPVDFITSFYYEGQNAYLCMLYFGEALIVKSLYKSMYVSGLFFVVAGIFLSIFSFVIFGGLLLIAKIIIQRLYWIELISHFFRILSFSALKGLIVTAVAHVTHELGFWYSLMTRKKPNCWAVEDGR
jgi:glycosyltransferase involved in cell wall biosynthesis